MSRLKLQWKVLLITFIAIQLTAYHFFFGSNLRSDLQPSLGPSGRNESSHIIESDFLPVATGSGWWEPPESLQNVIVAKYTSWGYGVVTQLGPPITRDCLKLRSDPRIEMERVDLMTQVKSWRKSSPWEKYALRFKTESCTEITQEFSNLFYVSEVEKEFPIAYILVVYTNPGQVLRFLKSIYRPHNLYCIHPDARQGQEFSDYFNAVAKCIDNIFVVSKPVKVYYAHSSILDAQLHCMQDLIEYPTSRWKYVINLSGREIPLKTNRQIVEALMKLNGYTAVNFREMDLFAWKDRFVNEHYINKHGELCRSSSKLLPKPPVGLTIQKSTAYLAASRPFVQFLFNDSLSLEFHKYLAKVRSAEEHYYASLYVLPQAKGGQPPTNKDMVTISKALWTPPMSNCPGKHIVHRFCILTALDLAIVDRYLKHQHPLSLFFNKYFLELDPTPMDCMEEYLVTTNIEEYHRDSSIL